MAFLRLSKKLYDSFFENAEKSQLRAHTSYSEAAKKFGPYLHRTFFVTFNFKKMPEKNLSLSILTPF